MARSPELGRGAAISRSSCAADRRTPDAIPRTDAMRCWPRPTSRCACDRLKRDGLTVNPSRIEGGSPSNVVPDLAMLRVNLRPRTPEIESGDQTRPIDDTIAAVAAEHDVQIEVHGGFGRPPKPLTRGGRSPVQARQAGRGRPWPERSRGSLPAAFATATISPPAECRWSTRWACAAARSTARRNF